MIIIIIMSTVFIIFAVTALRLGKSSFEEYKEITTENYEVVSAIISDIIKEVKRGGEDITFLYYPVFDFIYQNVPYSIKYSRSVSKRKSSRPYDTKSFAIGDNVNIRIYNNDVNTAIIDSKVLIKKVKKMAIGFYVIGIVLMIIGLLIGSLLFLF